ncbi:DUF4810 domain-containing protein [Halodesulfovibrio aestuarii]|uniref:DUF4810 domain-containing protein n=1 Tax=Halodesulfovibrio aestuarii TaxID=126333 RepID=A0A8G2F7C7_9BACT|nr:DUF4810 domain-containing protein [Halodesulfovibrio aestuarii]SHI83426.1 hypothetical protein SAMN05660830_01144 [Halodesulfovibrio aestuarii]
MRKLLVCCCLLLVGLVSGCVHQQRIEWCNYSQTYYAMLKEPTPVLIKEHQDELLHIIDNAETKNKPVPPGVFAEYGYMLAKEGKTKQAVAYYEREVAAYPESEQFVSMLVRMATPDGDAGGDVAKDVAAEKKQAAEKPAKK